MKWLNIAGAAILAFCLALLGMKSVQRKSDLDQAHEDEADRLNEDIADNLEDAAEQMDESGEAVDEGKAAENAMNEKLDQIGKSDANDIDDIAARSNSGRVRRKPGKNS